MQERARRHPIDGPDVAPLGADLVHKRKWVARLIDKNRGFNGNSWLVLSVPCLSCSPITNDGFPETVEFFGGEVETAFFKWTGSGYRALFDPTLHLILTGTEWIVYKEGGAQWHFFGPDAPRPLRGRVARWIGTSGEVTVATYDEQQLKNLTQVRRGELKTVSLNYSYIAEGLHARMLSEVIKSKADAGGPRSLWRVRFSYHLAREGCGMRNDLRTATAQQFDAQTGRWGTERTSYYRYYVHNWAPGFDHALKFEVGPDAVARLTEEGLALDAIPDGLLAKDADAYYEYDGDRRVVVAAFDGGNKVQRFVRLQSLGRRNWARRTIVTDEANGMVSTYHNDLNLPVLQIQKLRGKSVRHVWQYDSWGMLRQHLAEPEIADVIEPSSARENFRVVLKKQ